MALEVASLPLSAGFLERGRPLDPRRFLGFSGGRVLVKSGSLVWVQPDPNEVTVFLGNWQGTAFFAQNVPEKATVPGTATDFWSLPKTLAAPYLGLVCQGQHMLRWHHTNRFCAKCGTETRAQNWGRQRCCAPCAQDFYPRIDPAVIMLVQSPDRSHVVLANTKTMPAGLHSLLAGYVEPGEALEDAVRRETWEEAGLRVAHLTYVASQPWAQSRSLMVGFTCVADTWNLTIDTQELNSARWFSRADLTRAEADATCLLPRPNTIAHHVLKQWWHLASGDTP